MIATLGPTLLALLLAAAATADAAVEVGSVPVVRAGRSPAIDGVAEGAWSAAPLRSLERSKRQLPQSADVQAQFRVMWDEAALYLFVQVVDDDTVRNRSLACEDDSVTPPGPTASISRATRYSSGTAYASPTRRTGPGRCGSSTA
jgi:hypothetical protein